MHFHGLYVSIQQGLLGIPDMQIAGNHSSPFRFYWTQDRIDGALPRPWVLSLPLFVYRILMLLWALSRLCPSEMAAMGVAVLQRGRALAKGQGGEDAGVSRGSEKWLKRKNTRTNMTAASSRKLSHICNSVSLGKAEGNGCPEEYSHQRSVGFRIPIFSLCAFLPAFQSLQQRD